MTKKVAVNKKKIVVYLLALFAVSILPAFSPIPRSWEYTVFNTVISSSTIKIFILFAAAEFP